MHNYHYRPGKAAFRALICGGLALLCGWSWFSDPDPGILMPLAALLFGAGAAKLVMDAMSAVPAIAFDANGLRVRRTWGQVASVRWDEVQAIGVEAVVLRYYGIIPVARHEFLVVKCDGGVFGARRLRLAAKMIALPAGGIHELAALLNAAHLAAVGTAGVAMKGAGSLGWGARSGAAAPVADTQGPDFDADAALARYLARKDYGGAGAGAGAEPVAAAAAPPPPPRMPARPAFGRKTA